MEEIWTVKGLLEAIFEFVALSQDSNEWTEKSLNYNKPRLVRLQRIHSLFNAFEITSTKTAENKKSNGFFKNKKTKSNDLDKNELYSFFQGEFLKKQKEINDYKEIILCIEELAVFKNNPIKLYDITRLYSHLMDYRLLVNKILRHNSGAYEASNSGFQAAIILTKQINSSILEQVKQIDEILVKIIDPKCKKISEKELVEKFAFPKDDLNEIDFENF